MIWEILMSVLAFFFGFALHDIIIKLRDRSEVKEREYLEYIDKLEKKLKRKK